MSIAPYIREIGRGRDGARALSRADAAELFGQVLDGNASDLEVGAFCLAMRIKGETPQEMAGFLDATRQRIRLISAADRTVVVIPTYNGARKLPVLTPLLALLLARQGLPVLLHGAASESTRVFTASVLAALDILPTCTVGAIAPGEVAFVPTQALCPGLQRLLEVRRVVGLRNSAHSLVKLLDPCEGQSVVLGSYTHPEYARSMAEVFVLLGSRAMLLRGTEGEPVADPRRMPRMDGFAAGRQFELQSAQSGPLGQLPGLPTGNDPLATAQYTRDVLAGRLAVPSPIARQVEWVVHLATLK
jgi:anthranilate phosphoribosyltransferase